MNRLTERNRYGQSFAYGVCQTIKCPEFTITPKTKSVCDGCSVTKLVDRLASYEDTGFDPQEVTAIKHALMGQEIAKITEFEGVPVQRMKELSQANKDGQLVVLPCKVGDTVYVVFSNGIRPYVVDRIYIIASNEVQVRMRFNLTEILHISGANFGKSAFLTYEAAESVLAGNEAEHGKV